MFLIKKSNPQKKKKKENTYGTFLPDSRGELLGTLIGF